MINKKAPKDMTATEFVDFLINGNVLPSIPDDDSFIAVGVIKGVLEMPAPNPFTPDQLAWMRVEQMAGFLYSAVDRDGYISAYSYKPVKNKDDWGVSYLRSHCFGNTSDKNPIFLEKFLSCEDEEPLCFADYAPLE